MMENIQDFRGILFEATANGDGLHVHCVLRGEAADVEAVKRIAAGSEPTDSQPRRPLGALALCEESS